VGVPYIEVKAVEGRFQVEGAAERLIAALTDAACEVFGEESRSQIWVVLEGVPPARFGVGGRPLG
jgi:4-oxalocrotonate tautomerase